MSFVTGMFLIDAPASALNNLGQIEGERFANSTGVKVIRTKDGYYPYVSAQALRYWLRNTLEQTQPDWKAAPIYREEKIAYTDANPIKWWDDDLFGYMRAPSKRESAKSKRNTDETRSGETETTDTITRVAPFRMSTLVSIAPVTPTNDFGVMSRHEGDPVPHEHQFYRATLKGLFSLNLNAAGTFWYRQKTGFRNLDDVRIEEAKKAKLQEIPGQKAYRLPLEQRIDRITTLFQGMAVLDGGAKQTLHYTDVAPAFIVMAITKGGNHIFNHMIGTNGRGSPVINIDALKETLTVFEKEIISNVYIGWVRGYLDEERAKLETFLENSKNQHLQIQHPREAFISLISALKEDKNGKWLE